MDKILLGVAASIHPEGMKRALFEKLVLCASKPLSKEEVTPIFQLSSQWITNEDGFLHEMGVQVFNAWAKYNPATFEEFFCHRFLISTVGETVTQPLSLVRFIRDCLGMLRLKRDSATKIIRMQVISLCRGLPDILVQGEICRLLLAHPDCVPEDGFTTTLCQTLITNTSVLEVPETEAELRACVDAVASIGGLLRVIWSANPATIIPSLKHVFNIISTVADSEAQSPSLALGALVQHVPINLVEAVTKSAVSDASVADSRMTVALQRMVDWILWPNVVNIDRWIITFLTSLAAVHKFTILINVSLSTVEMMLLRLCTPLVRESAFRILSHMLLSFQHSPEAFHKIILHVPQLMERLKQEDSPSSHSCRSKVAELAYCLMYHHAGYPDLYDTLLDALREFPRPSEEAMMRRLKEGAWTLHGGGLSANISSKFAPRSDTGKTGLVNLGNTCYMNSVLQALFMTSGFHDDILSYPLINRQSIMYNIQLTFAFLTHTQRAAYAPKDFLQASRPPWFSPGSQQDCSEFLKYLLDRLDEEEKGWRKMMKKAAASLSTSLSSPSSSTSSTPVESSQEMDDTERGDDKMEAESGTSPDESSSSSPPMSSQCVPVASSHPSQQTSDSNRPVCQPSDEVMSIPALVDMASCSRNLSGETSQPTSSQLFVGDKKWTSAHAKSKLSAEVRKSIVERYFGGKSATHIRCLNCGIVSTRTETFFDLPLAFPGMEGRENLLGGHCDTPAEERRSDKSEYATVDLPQDTRSVVGAGSLVSTVGPNMESSAEAVSAESFSVPGSSANRSTSRTCLEDLLKHYLTPERLVKENRYHCNKCQSLQDAEKSLEITAAPEILIVTLLRFSYDVKLHRRCKILEDVRYPQMLHLEVADSESECSADGSHGGPCTKRTRQNSVGTAHCSTERERARTIPYMLSAVIVHSGMSSESGHYYCYACDDVDEHVQLWRRRMQSRRKSDEDGGDEERKKREEEDTLPNKWYLFNDSRVTASKFESFGNVTQRFPRDTPYVLFYRKCKGDWEEEEDCSLAAALRGVPSSSISRSLREKKLRRDLQEAVNKDNSMYIQERELETRSALRNQRPASAATPFFPRNFDDKNDPPGGCGLGGGGGGGGLGLSSSRLVF
ncbi:ubiquitin carboxyl-terminal hydrolase 38-like [Diadema antillarum]|uniref:ubiquitin carboxyl-terminal hydrolase 38-like n=1 Tax=Diadema antillarum TaxID=105358 RepID=UPI003A848E4E